MAYLEDLGCLGTALVELLGGEVDFRVMDGFEIHLFPFSRLFIVKTNGSKTILFCGIPVDLVWLYVFETFRNKVFQLHFLYDR